ALARERGSASGFALISTHRARLAHRRGALREAEGEARAALNSGALEGWYRLGASGMLIVSLADQGRVEEAQAAYDATAMGERMPDHRPVTPFLIARGVLRHAQGHLERALTDLREARARIARFARHTGAGLDARVLTASILRQLGRRDEALHEADETLAAARTWGAPGTLGVTMREHALVLGGPGALAQLREAEQLLARSPLRLEHAITLIDLGAMLRRSGRRADSREPLREGLELAERAAATPLVQRARDELSASGVRVPRQRIGDELTPSERRIVEMASAGATNPQIAQALFVTTKTVEGHLANAYRKLGISSRRDLTNALARSSSKTQ
ncbi:MAG: LuxR C-terminal-related transcriptional regulator, partial [Actinobacteria bacterium]|nr:LuxR C-terminal-related transcriptional regulator [Actinomycetota bacterium]